MALQDFLDQLDELGTAAESAFGDAADTETLEAARVTFLGAKKGRLKSIQQQMGSIEREDKPMAGKAFNATKGRIEAAFEAAQQRSNNTDSDSVANAQFDASLPGATFRCGNVHPITQTIEELKEIMGRLGFSIVDGPEIEDDWHNFVALNIPDDHPARDPLENFYLATAAASSGAKDPVGLLLRSQTSTVQIRVMEKTAPPIRIISLGRVYRPDTADATHYPMFHQIEGLMIDTNVSLADLKSVLRLFATSYLGDDVTIRFRPSFFPFTEPSVEADYYWNGQWVEFGGAGMVDPNVLKAVGYDPEEVTGFAFGLGVERLCMRRHGVTDIREFYKNDVRFLAQF
ncbi:MAG TPA: phenylalanine--tRNA ligase subunit alpha [Planctomycetes bacterium]|nr:phenylalanine--tRNA ligase subunit alpha [Planctomycetaceae bacterium]HIN54477.1 phenylalanine--tRNA ligase subunit alpha [Planctomycetota bacterium]